LTAVVYLSTLTTFWVMVAAVRPGAPYLTTLAVAQLPTVLATFMPTPGGAGILEIVTASLFLTGTADGRPGGGIDRAAGGTIAAAILGWRLLTFYTRFGTGPIAGATFARPAVEGGGEAGAGGPPTGSARPGPTWPRRSAATASRAARRPAAAPSSPRPAP